MDTHVGVLACALAAAVIGDVLFGSGDGRRLVVTGGSALVLLAVGVAGSEWSQFSFDPHRRVVLWRRNCGWSRRTGSLSFDQVRDVLAESPIGDEGIASRRLSLMVAAGGTLPLTIGYSADLGDATLHLGERIRGLSKSGRVTELDAVAVLAAS